ncbi:hypothetical protein C2E25_07735 [Geothermobacter hydrogeniphilus]|uniref:histidine kinase n=1 Tax=Geothermobacter hydrogeniphilus TaxID=1969733 RepID=A0A2K2HAL5_9BACT|nr:ATP-binding protein [Geothermobacter hydrogeniphilus]PNU20307.1 hypothetical protein C2E25_07735 [Geothermobacter hydrogeniphilus]
MNFLTRLHFRQKLTLLISIALIVPLLASVLLFDGMINRQLNHNFSQRLEADLGALTLLQKHLRNSLEQGVAGLANDNTLQITSDLKILPQLQNYLQRQSRALDISALQVFTPSGHLLAATAKLPQSCFDAPGTHLLTEGQGAVLCTRSTIQRGEKLIGYIVGGERLTLETIGHHAPTSLFDNFLLTLDGRVFLSNLESPPDNIFSELSSTEKDATITLSGTGYRSLSRCVDNEEHQLCTSVLLPLKPLQHSFWRTGMQITGLALLLYLILLTILQRLIKGLTGPIHRLTRAASLLEKGSEQELKLDLNRADEFGLLNRTFAHMARTQRNHTRELEARVAQRTAELQKTNDALRHDILARQKTEREKAQLEAQLRQTQKMEALGAMAGGIAHDFNNILMPIICFADLAHMRLAEDHETRPLLEEILKAGNRAKDLVGQILAFSRQDKQKRQPVNLAESVSEAMKLVRASTPAGIDICMNIDASNLWVEANATQLHQLILNLCTNAVQAMGDKGRLEIRVKQDESAQAVLKVSDNGPGIPADILEHIFEPFFTTKEAGQGTGIGLAMVHGIVRNHHGTLNVQSSPDNGTTFEVRFPCCDFDNLPLEETTGELPGGKERILVVDDEPAILLAWQTLLEDLGYRVTTAEKPETALKEAMKEIFSFDLLITDQNMPGMSGSELALAIRDLNPTLPVIICTGYSESCSPEDAHHLGFDHYLHKPCRSQELAGAVRQVLDRREGSGNDSQPTRTQNTDKDVSSPTLWDAVGH